MDYGMDLSTFLHSSPHGRQRREERHITKATLVLARRYGMKETDPRTGRFRYTYAGITFIYDPISETEITSYGSADYASPISGTRHTLPLFPRRKFGPENEGPERLRHAQIRTELFRTRDKWTSHTVFVVDISGSMRTDDVDGARCRSDGVWLSLAKDFVEWAIQSNHASITDVISVIVMSDTSSIILRCEPTDYVLFNILLDFREWDMIRPEGHGNYLPALDKAVGLLRQYDTRKQALSLVFVSDGTPSDEGDFAGTMGKIAQEFGRRLSFVCIGIGNDDDGDFQVLQDMVREAKSFHSNASFYRAGLNVSSLSNIVTCLSSFTAMSKVEMTRFESLNQLTVRNDVLREKMGAPDDLAIGDGWTVYNSRSLKNGVIRIWAWDRVKDDFVCVMDPRCWMCFDLVADCRTMEPIVDKGELCPICNACFICHGCKTNPECFNRHSPAHCQQWLKQRRRGAIVTRFLPSFSIAIKNAFFSEGVERMVAKTRFLDETNLDFIGPKMVAKQSRFVEEDSSYEARMDYHRQFLRTQSIASAMATKFNAAVRSRLVDSSSSSSHRIPTVRFLEPLVLELADQNQQEVNQLVEEMLVGRYEKFNNNMGFVRHDAHRGVICCPENGESFPIYMEPNNCCNYNASLSTRVHNLFQSPRRHNIGSLTTVPEQDKKTSSVDPTKIASTSLTGNVDPYDMIQAFSHFTFEYSKHNLVVIDLQGIIDMDQERPEVVLTDPAIHTRNNKNNHLHHLNLGRTDRGDKGIASFFQTHECGPTCQLLGLDRNVDLGVP